MRKVLFIGHRNLLFGAESVMFRSIELILKEKHSEVHIALPKSKDVDFSDALVNLSISNILIVPFKLVGNSLIKSLLGIIWNFYAAFQLIVYCKKNKIDSIYTNTSVNIVGPMVSIFAGKKHLWYFHEQPTGSDFRWIAKAIYPLYRFLITRKKTTIVFISKTQKRLWEQEFRTVINNCEIIYTPPIQLKQLAVNMDGNIVSYGFLGSLTPSKNILELIKAFAKLEFAFPDKKMRLVIQGGGVLKYEIEHTVKILNIQESVLFLPHSKNVEYFFSLIDVFVLPSKFESWGLAALEALSLKKCLILTKNTALDEILVNNDDCIFINPDDEHQIYEAMKSVSFDSSFKYKLINNGYDKLINLELDKSFVDASTKLFL